MKRLLEKLKLKEKHYDIGIISFNINTSAYNFGAALHSFAFQKFLDKLGVSNVIINYSRINFLKHYAVKKFFKHILKFKYNYIIPDIYVLACILYKKIKFYRFFKKNCCITNKKYKINTLPELNTINRYVAETDVIWDRFKQGYDRAFMCDLPNMKNQNNIAYSVDFGSKEIPKEDQIALKEYSNNFKHISIRNPARLEEYRKITGRQDTIVTIDPVLLLNKEDYEKIIPKTRIKKDYVFVYNCQENNPEMVEQAKNFAKENNLDIKIVNCYTKNIRRTMESAPTPIGIEKFLSYIKNSKYIFTNSYHGICFSVIFEKDFFAYARQANNGKIISILSLLGLESRLTQTYAPPPESNIDYSSVKKHLLELKITSESFIKNAINL